MACIITQSPGFTSLGRNCMARRELRVWFKPRMALTIWTLILTVWDSPNGIRATPYKVGNIDVRAKWALVYTWWGMDWRMWQRCLKSDSLRWNLPSRGGAEYRSSGNLNPWLWQDEKPPDWVTVCAMTVGTKVASHYQWPTTKFCPNQCPCRGVEQTTISFLWSVTSGIREIVDSLFWHQHQQPLRHPYSIHSMLNVLALHLNKFREEGCTCKVHAFQLLPQHYFGCMKARL